MGEMPIVAVNDYKKIIETFQKDGDAYAGRTWLHEWSEYLGGKPSATNKSTPFSYMYKTAALRSSNNWRHSY